MEMNIQQLFWKGLYKSKEKIYILELSQVSSNVIVGRDYDGWYTLPQYYMTEHDLSSLVFLSLF